MLLLVKCYAIGTSVTFDGFKKLAISDYKMSTSKILDEKNKCLIKHVTTNFLTSLCAADLISTILMFGTVVNILKQ